MHESALVYRILDTISPSIKPQHTLRRISIEVGEFSCVNTSTLIQLFDIAKKRTFAENSELKLSIVKENFDINIKSIEVS